MSEFKYTKEQRAWLDDLKKTRAKQTINGALHDEDGWCCLGRLCHVLKIESMKVEGGAGNWIFGGRGEKFYLPSDVAERLYMDFRGISKKQFYIGEKPFTSLAGANDGGCTFKQIAKAIEADPNNFFTRGAE